MCTEGEPSKDFLQVLHNEFFVRMDYDWWRPVQEGDIVMDIGTHIGMFTAHALDRGAKKVYAIEPNKTLLRTTMKNAFPHIVNKKESPVIPINCMIGNNDKDKDSADIYGEREDDEVFEMRSFKQIIEEYEIDHIDYLKIDCEGGEYSIFVEENLEFIKNHVKHMAVEFHITINETAAESFKRVRDEFLCHFDNIKFMQPETPFWMTDAHLDNLDSPHYGGWFMLYILNENIS